MTVSTDLILPYFTSEEVNHFGKNFPLKESTSCDSTADELTPSDTSTASTLDEAIKEEDGRRKVSQLYKEVVDPQTNTRKQTISAKDLPSIAAPQQHKPTLVQTRVFVERRQLPPPSTWSTVKISQIVESVWNAYAKQRYFCYFLRNVQRKILELINDYSINSSQARPLNESMQNTAGQSSMLYEDFQQHLSHLIQVSETYLCMPVVPFFMEVTQFEIKLLKIYTKISKTNSLSGLDDELKCLHVYAQNRFGVPWVEGDAGFRPEHQSTENDTMFLMVLQTHFEKLNKYYDSYLRSKGETALPISLYASFDQLIMECNEYLDAAPQTACSQNIHLFKEKLDNAWINLTNTGNMKADLIGLQHIIDAAQDAV